MSNNISENNKRIAKNSMYLYIRMFFIMAVTLFTSRVILKALGVTDFGIYNVVGGIVVMLGVLNQSLTASIQRYLSFEIGKGDKVQLKKVFSVCLNLYILISIIFVILSETVGLWFLNNKLLIPTERMTAANWVYQFAILSCIATIIANVFNAVIISHERMNFYAYISIIEVSLKLGVAYMILSIGGDKLIAYGLLMCIVSAITGFCYTVYCLKNFEETRYSYYNDKKLFNELFAYSGWNLFGVVSGMFKTQGLNILLNMFFLPVVNASRGIAVQVNNAVGQFFNNFFLAVRPQLTIYYAQDDKENLMKLLFRSTKLSVFLIMFISTPLLIETSYIIQLWLGQEPEYVVSFTRLIILITAVDSMANPLMTVAQATGRIKLYQSTVGTMIMLNIPISYVFLRFGFNPNTVFVISLVISIICLFMRVWIVKRLIPYFTAFKYIWDAIFLSTLSCLIAFILPCIVYYILPDEDFMSFCAVGIMSVISTLTCYYYVGLNKSERHFVGELISKKILHRK